MQSAIRIPLEGGGSLAGVLHSPETTCASGVVCLHGMLSHKNGPKQIGLAQRLEARGHKVLRFDFTGRGESSGDLLQLSFERELAEAQAAIGWLGQQGVERLVLVGSSMGGAVALLAAAQQTPHGLVTLAAIGRSDLLPERIVGSRGVALWQRRGWLRFEGERVGYALVESARRTDLLANAARVGCHWLIVHGEKDEVIPVSDAQELAQAAKSQSELMIVPGADHQFSDPGIREAVLERVADFCEAALVPALPAEDT